MRAHYLFYETFLLALPQRHVVPVAGGGPGLSARLLQLPHIGQSGLPGGVKPVPPDPDAPARVGEAEGVQGPTAAQDHDLSHPAAGLHQVDGIPDPYGGFRQRLLHTNSVSAAAPGDK